MKLGSYGLTYAIFFLSLLSYLLIINHKRKPQRKAEPPPGSMGWPLIGETLHFYSQHPNLFFATKQKRYGEIFKTHLLGCPCVMLASPEASKFVLVNRAHLFKPTYPPSKERMIGPWALFFHEGPYHTRVRRLVQASFSPDAVRELIPDIEAVVISMLESWDGHVASTFQVMKKFSFNVTILAIFGGGLDKSYREELESNYLIINNGYNSFPTHIPGTRYNKAIQARKRLDKILREVMSERRKKLQAADTPNDLLRRLMDSRDEEGGYLTDDQIADNIIGVLFAGQDTTASVITWIIKYLHDDQKLLETVKAEQIAIQRETQSLTWAQIRSMAFTNRVLLESLRMASIISFTFREAVADVEYKGYLIPKGWKVMPLFRNIHHNPDFFVDPEKLEPSRFKVPPKPNTFLPFGNGVHACPGNELAKIEILLLIHHLVTKYRLEVVGSTSEVEYSPFPVPKHGFRAQLLLCSRDSNSATATATAAATTAV